MPDEALLSELCSLCYAETPKYRCPRCKTKTCSLPCYKKHQQRASCNGKRDPAEYLKKRELATPAGIDRDYNYLKSIERDIDHASKDTRERGVNARLSKHARRNLEDTSNFQKYLIEHNINVQSAPRGMSRQKSNHSHTTNRNNVLWTLEWIDVAGISELQHDCMDSERIGHLHTLMQRKQRRADKRSRDGDAKAAKSKKRKDEQKASVVTTTVEPVREGDVSVHFEETQGRLDQADELPNPAASASQHPSEQMDDTKEPADIVQRTDEKPYLYLLKPSTAVGAKVLAPLSPEQTLTKCLEDRTVLEYPTIYALPQAPGSLPAGFMLEKQYIRIRKREENELRDAMSKAGKNAVSHRADNGAGNARVDPSKILDMLKRDISR
ncbi:hypothetical protein DOTSEDRAFT_74573 [Dothistroma septosporum NZE10]|uniref:HIT-type domain-containing protein n=1 Tax=Dothistroma septosporum (strain NZE10 / CBS 128990) TaxID=675120 RepID=N1PFD2_DOTSN|nr:hypothetical protein DOTSEDRAFT_74573 [Dothistroma septosporum NZE10]